MPTNGHDHEELAVLPPNAFYMRRIRGNDNNNNNNNNQELNVGERLVAFLFYKATVGYAKIIPRFLRRVIEFVFLLKAVFSFFVLVYVHINFSQVPAGCLDLVKDIWPRDGVLIVEIIPSFKRSVDTSKDNSTLFYRSNKTNNPENKKEVDMEPSTEELVENKFQETNTNLFNYLSFTNYKNFKDEKKEMLSSTTKTNYHNSSKFNFSIVKDSAQFRSTKDLNSYIRNLLEIDSLLQLTSTKLPLIDDYKVKFNANYIVEYSLDMGSLILSPSARNRSGIPVMIVALELTHNKCYGDLVSQFFLKNFLCYDDFLVLYVKSLSENEQDKGFMRNVISGEYLKFGNISTARTLYIASFFIMVVFTLLISTFTSYLRHQIFVVIGFHRSLSLPGFLTLFLAAYGLDAIMSQFFKGTTSGCVLWIVLLAEQYVNVCSCCPITKRHWLKFFYLYHFSFYAYHYRFNGQYSDLALSCSWCFIQHSMIYFYHHYVMPRVLQRADPLQRFIQRRPQLQHRRRQQHQSSGGGSSRPEGRSPMEVTIMPIQNFSLMNRVNNLGRLRAMLLRRLRMRTFESQPTPTTRQNTSPQHPRTPSTTPDVTRSAGPEIITPSAAMQ